MNGRGLRRGRSPRGASWGGVQSAMGRRLFFSLFFSVLLYTDTLSSTTIPNDNTSQLEEILQTTLFDMSTYDDYTSKMLSHDQPEDTMDQFASMSTLAASSQMVNIDDKSKFPELVTESTASPEQPFKNLYDDPTEEESLPATLGFTLITNDARRPSTPEGSTSPKLVWGEVGRGFVAASSGDDREGRRPPILVPGLPAKGRSRSGPYFEEENPLANITMPAGSTILLDCRVAMLRDKVVTWAARRADRLQLLTVGLQPYSADKRVTLSFKYPNNWRLRIEEARKDDQGLYECQVAAHPPIIRQVYLTVISPEISIFDESGRSVVERYYKAGSFLQLTCSAIQLLEPPSMLSWWQGNAPLTEGISCNVTGPDSATCTLVVEQVTRAHAGTYTCGSGSAAAMQSATAPEGTADHTLPTPGPAVTYTANASVAVHVLHGNLLGVAVLPNTGKSIGAKGESNISVQEIILGIALGLFIQGR